MTDDTTTLAELLAAVPLFMPVGESRRGRISSTSANPGEETPSKVVVDFGSTPEGPDHGPDLEIATRIWGGGEPGERDIRGFCAERDLMERRMRDPLSAQSFTLPDAAAWSAGAIAVDDVEHPLTVLETPQSWVATAALPGGVLLRVFTPAPGPGPRALRRISHPDQLEPVRGRG